MCGRVCDVYLKGLLLKRREVGKYRSVNLIRSKSITYQMDGRKLSDRGTLSDCLKLQHFHQLPEYPPVLLRPSGTNTPQISQGLSDGLQELSDPSQT